MDWQAAKRKLWVVGKLDDACDNSQPWGEALVLCKNAIIGKNMCHMGITGREQEEANRKRKPEDNIEEWSGKQLSETLRSAGNPKEWRKLIFKE